MSFKVGDLVECVDVSPGLMIEHDLRRGELYTILWSGPGPLSGTPCVQIDKSAVQRAHKDAFYRASRFRHVHTPKAGFIEALKALPADLVREPA